jgi:hypothetical protein
MPVSFHVSVTAGAFTTFTNSSVRVSPDQKKYIFFGKIFDTAIVIL